MRRAWRREWRIERVRLEWIVPDEKGADERDQYEGHNEDNPDY